MINYSGCHTESKCVHLKTLKRSNRLHAGATASAMYVIGWPLQTINFITVILLLLLLTCPVVDFWRMKLTRCLLHGVCIISCPQRPCSCRLQPAPGRAHSLRGP
mmetsp:Transcript_41255/g.86170  ORF Transcript_41255/g.86170 Transcript_41255/m.86170 type:complete len:104 (-) Transcript_41255:169-480(-)